MIPVEYLIALRDARPAGQDKAVRDSSPLSPAQQRTMTRLRHAALEVFEEKGYDDATAVEVSQRAGVSRRTFFRYFPAKTDALFSDHAAHLARLGELLGEARPDRLERAGRALAIVLDEYLTDADFVRRRAALVAASPALRDRELLWTEEYQRRLGAYLATGTTTDIAAIWAEITASAVLTAFRSVLARWSTQQMAQEPRSAFDRLMREIAAGLRNPTEPEPPVGASTTIITTTLPAAEIALLIQAAETQELSQ